MTSSVRAKTVFIIFLPLITLFFLQANILNAETKSPEEVVKMFIAGYGTARMDEAADLTTDKFRGDRPKSVWVVETWKTLNAIEYGRKESKVIDSRIGEKKAVVLVESEITTNPANAVQREIYILTKDENRWLIDDLIVTDEKIKLDDYEL